MDSGVIEQDVTLRDGRSVHLRAIRASDEAEVLQAFERMSADARYMRFMHAVRELNLERLRRTLASFPESGIGIVATVPAADGIDIVGNTVLVFSGGAASGEFAISVAADYGGAGLGRTMMNALIDAAKRRGVADVEGFVLAANAPMLRLAARLGFKITRDPKDATVRICRLHLADPQLAPGKDHARPSASQSG